MSEGPMDLKTVLENVGKSAVRVQSIFHKQITPELMKIVVGFVSKELSKNRKAQLDKSDVAAIREKLIPRTNPRSRTSWLRHFCYNKLAKDLNQKGIVQCKFIFIPTQIERKIIIHPTDELQNNVRLLQLLQEDLLTLRVEQPGSLEEEELEVVCSFIAAAGIFGKMLFDKYHRKLLGIKFRDVHFSPACINVPFPNSDAFYRYFLPFPASAYFMRCILFYQRNNRKLDIKKPYRPEDPIITPVHFDIDSLATKFSKWTAKRLQQMGEKESKGLTIAQFRNAAKAASITNVTSGPKSFNNYPPFIIAVQSGEISNYSYTNDYLERFFGVIPDTPDYRNPVKKTKKLIANPQTDPVLRKVLREIRKVRGILPMLPDSMPDRIEIADQIVEIIDSYYGILKERDYLNLELYGRWIKTMLETKFDFDLVPASVNNYIPKVEKLVCELSTVGVVYQLSQEKLTKAVARVLGTANTPPIRRIVKKFTDLIEQERKDFKNIDWENPELAKEEVTSLKPLITSTDVATAVHSYYLEFSRPANRMKAGPKKFLELRKARHKALILEHFTRLAYYTGMRVNEIATLRINNVIYDDGIVLCVRESKTKNGYRNIQLSRLAPRHYVRKFEQYFRERKKWASGNKVLFSRIDGGKWNSGLVSREVGKIIRSIIPDARFHNLRGSFASLFLLRWFVAFHEDKIARDLPFLKDELFGNDESLENLRELILGKQQLRVGQDSFTYALAVLARLMGHGGPEVTIECYAHTIDWLFYLLSERNKPATIDITDKKAQSFCQVTKNALREEIKKASTTIKADDFMKYQRSYIKHAKHAHPIKDNFD